MASCKLSLPGRPRIVRAPCATIGALIIEIGILRGIMAILILYAGYTGLCPL